MSRLKNVECRELLKLIVSIDMCTCQTALFTVINDLINPLADIQLELKRFNASTIQHCTFPSDRLLFAYGTWLCSQCLWNTVLSFAGGFVIDLYVCVCVCFSNQLYFGLNLSSEPPRMCVFHYLFLSERFLWTKDEIQFWNTNRLWAKFEVGGVRIGEVRWRMFLPNTKTWDKKSSKCCTS